MKVCPDCGANYRSLKLHKDGASRMCETRLSARICYEDQREAMSSGWVSPGLFYTSIHESDIPLRVVKHALGCEVEDRWWAPGWAVSIAEMKGFEVYQRARAIRRLFLEVDMRKVFQAEMALAHPAQRRGKAAELVSDLNFMSRWSICRNS